MAALLAMPSATGLFRRAIVQSMPIVFLTPELAADIAVAFAAELGLRPTELATVAPRTLPAAGDAVMAKMTDSSTRVCTSKVVSSQVSVPFHG